MHCLPFLHCCIFFDAIRVWAISTKWEPYLYAPRRDPPYRKYEMFASEQIWSRDFTRK